MSISPQSLARTRDKRSHKIPARFNDTVYNEAHYVEATQTQVLRTSTRSRPSPAGLKRDLDEEETDEEEVTKPTKSSNRSSSHSKRPNKSLSNETSPVTADTNTRTVAPIVTAPTTTKAAAITTTTATIARPSTLQTWNPPISQSPSATGSLISATSSTKVLKPASSKSKKKPSSAKDKVNGTSLIFKKPPISASRKPDDIKKATTPQLAPTILGASNNNLLSHNTSHHINPSVGAKTFATPLSVLPGSPSQTTTNYINQGVRHFNGLTPNHHQYGTRMMINEQVYLPRSVGTIAPITTSLAQISNQARRPPLVSKKAQACLDYQNQRKLNHIASTHYALIRIAQNLGFNDRVSLRAVSRNWKSISDCNDLWKKIIFDNADSRINEGYLEYKLKLHLTDEIYFNEYEGDPRLIFYWFGCKKMVSRLKRIKLRSVTPEQNSVAFAILYSIKMIKLGHEEIAKETIEFDESSANPLIAEWQIKVGVDELGIATVKLSGEHMTDSARQSFRQGKHEEEEDGATGRSKFFRLEFHDLKKEIFGPELMQPSYKITLGQKEYAAEDLLKLAIRAI